MFYLQLFNSFEGLGMFFSSAALIRRLRKYNATPRDPHSYHSQQPSDSLAPSPDFSLPVRNPKPFPFSTSEFLGSDIINENPSCLEPHLKRCFLNRQALSPLYQLLIDQNVAFLILRKLLLIIVTR